MRHPEPLMGVELTNEKMNKVGIFPRINQVGKFFLVLFVETLLVDSEPLHIEHEREKRSKERKDQEREKRKRRKDQKKTRNQESAGVKLSRHGAPP